MSENVTPSSPYLAGSEQGSVSHNRGSAYSYIAKTAQRSPTWS